MAMIRCEDCGIGYYQPLSAPFLLAVGSRMMTIPDAPAYSCDVCGFRTFDEEFLDAIHSLLTQAAAAPGRQTAGSSERRVVGEARRRIVGSSRRL